MKARLNYAMASPETFKGMKALQDVVNTSGLETSLKDLQRFAFECSHERSQMCSKQTQIAHRHGYVFT